jgi:hypothetical protein
MASDWQSRPVAIQGCCVSVRSQKVSFAAYDYISGPNQRRPLKGRGNRGIAIENQIILIAWLLNGFGLSVVCDSGELPGVEEELVEISRFVANVSRRHPLRPLMARQGIAMDRIETLLYIHWRAQRQASGKLSLPFGAYEANVLLDVQWQSLEILLQILRLVRESILVFLIAAFLPFSIASTSSARAS